MIWLWLSLFSHCAGAFVKASRQFVHLFFFFRFVSTIFLSIELIHCYESKKIAGLETTKLVVLSTTPVWAKIITSIMLFLKLPRPNFEQIRMYDETKSWIVLSSVALGRCWGRSRLWNLSLKAVSANLILSRWNLGEEKCGLDGGWLEGRAESNWGVRIPFSTLENVVQFFRNGPPFYLFDERRRN